MPLVKDLPVAKNLQDHFYAYLFFKLHSSNATVHDQHEQNDGIYYYLRDKSGPLSSIKFGTFTAFANNLNINSNYSNLHYFHNGFKKKSPRLIGTANSFIRPVRTFLLNEGSKSEIVAVYIGLAKPESTGSIKIKSPNILDQTKISFDFLKSKNDKKVFLKAIKEFINLSKTEIFIKNEMELLRLPLDECDKELYLSDKYLECYIRYAFQTGWQTVGGSQMGRVGDKRTVVDQTFKVKGIKGLRQIDAGVIPTIMSSSTSAPTIMIGERGADFIKKEYGYETILDF